MKQQITTKQLNELNGKGKEELRDWQIEHRYWNKREGLSFKTNVGVSSVNILSIGQMIEFLRKGNIVTIYMDVVIIGVDERKIEYKELCDALWKATKEVLEK